MKCYVTPNTFRRTMILITGAGGFLGTTLTRVFVEAGHRVRAADLVPPSTQGAAEAVELDVTRPETVRTAMEGVVVVVHAAGIFDLSCSEQALRVNITKVGSQKDQRKSRYPVSVLIRTPRVGP